MDFTVFSPKEASMNAGRLETLRKSILSDIDSGKIYGGAMIVARYGKIVLREAFGRVSEDRDARLDDLYLSMSVSKSFTAALTLKAVEAGVFGLDTRVAEILPQFGKNGKEKISVFHVLTHQAGLFTMPVLPGLTPRDMCDIDKVFAALCELGADFEAGAKSSYSSFASYSALGKILEATDKKGRKFNQIAKDELFAPLGMNNTRFGDAADDPKRVSVTHTPLMGGAAGAAKATQDFLNSMVGKDCSVPAANAFTTIDELFTFAQALHDGGKDILSPAMVRYATQNHCGEMANETFRGECEKLNIAPLRAHFGLHGGYARGSGHLLSPLGYTAGARAFGGMGGGSTFYMVEPELGLTTAFLSSGFIEGLAHAFRTARLNDMAIAACD